MFEAIKALVQSDGLLIAICAFLMPMACIWLVGTREDKSATNTVALSHDLKDAHPIGTEENQLEEMP